MNPQPDAVANYDDAGQVREGAHCCSPTHLVIASTAASIRVLTCGGMATPGSIGVAGGSAVYGVAVRLSRSRRSHPGPAGGGMPGPGAFSGLSYPGIVPAGAKKGRCRKAGSPAVEPSGGVSAGV